MMGGFISFKYFKAFTICMIMDRASFSDINLCCFRQKSRSFPSQYSNTVQNLKTNKPTFDREMRASRLRLTKPVPVKTSGNQLLLPSLFLKKKNNNQKLFYSLFSISYLSGQRKKLLTLLVRSLQPPTLESVELNKAHTWHTSTAMYLRQVSFWKGLLYTYKLHPISKQAYVIKYTVLTTNIFRP